MEWQKDLYPIEGDFLETTEGFIFEVKGFEHPKDRIIAYIRYVNPNIRKEKLYELKDRFLFLQNHAPHYIYQPEWLDFPIQAVPKEKITKIYLSNQETEKIISDYERNKNIRSESLKKTIEFIKMLSEGANVPVKFFGITGSHLIGREHNDSDIDLIVFGRLNSKKVREVVRNRFSNQHAKLKPYSYQELKEHFKFRAKGSSITPMQFISAESRKLHQGFYEETEFFIRFFEYETREEYRIKFGNPESTRIIAMGRVRLKATIRDDYNWWTTPSVVEFGNIENVEVLEKSARFDEIMKEYCLDLNEITGSYTLRGRYTENVKLLETVIIEGKLEMVFEPSKNPKLRIYLGSYSEDKLYPI